MSILTGTRFATYEITALLGAGGMGEVYHARDERLGRDVALKVLAPRLADDRAALARFEQEARSASALSHPHILHIYDIGTAEVAGRPVRYMTMELVDGVTFGEKIRDASLPLRDLLAWLVQVADGLAKAHAAGIVHRDLKPDNLMITRDGYAKILDFGLAKLLEKDVSPDDATLAGAAPHSTPGLVVGTAAYMSPEQAQGRPADERSDVFSFGCILYEAASRLQRRLGHRHAPPRAVLRARLRDSRPERGARGAQVSRERSRPAVRVDQRSRRRPPPVECGWDQTPTTLDAHRRVAVRRSQPRARQRILRRRPDRGDHVGPVEDPVAVRALARVGAQVRQGHFPHRRGARRDARRRRQRAQGRQSTARHRPAPPPRPRVHSAAAHAGGARASEQGAGDGAERLRRADVAGLHASDGRSRRRRRGRAPREHRPARADDLRRAGIPPPHGRRLRARLPLAERAAGEGSIFGYVYLQMTAASGRFDEVRRKLPEIEARRNGDPFLAPLGFVIARALSGDPAAAQLLTEDLLQAARLDYQYSSWVAEIYATLGDRDRALEWLENSVSRGFAAWPFISAHDRLLDPLRGDPRFDRRLERMRSAWESYR